mgnify:CR=1 FL=1
MDYLDKKYKDKVILHITKLIEIYNPNLKELYDNCILKYGNYGIKYPTYIQELYNIDDKLNHNNENITFDDFINKIKSSIDSGAK